MPSLLDKALERVRAWPQSRQDDLARIALEMDEQDTTRYHLSDEERAALEPPCARQIREILHQKKRFARPTAEFHEVIVRYARGAAILAASIFPSSSSYRSCSTTMVQRAWAS